MRIGILVAFLSAMTSTAGTATIGPPIAYSTTSTIYLVNPDGTGLRSLYTAPRKLSVNSLDLKAGGGEVAFIENYRLKILAYDNNGLPVGAARAISIPCGTILAVDHHPSDGSVIARDGCSPYHIWRVAAEANSADPEPLLTSTQPLGGGVWSADGTRIYYQTADGVHALDPNTGQSPNVHTGNSIWDVTRTGDRMIMSAASNGYFVLDLNNGTRTDGCTQGQIIRFGNGDTQMVYRSTPDHGAPYILLQNSDCSGAPFRITGKSGTYPGLDWAVP